MSMVMFVIGCVAVMLGVAMIGFGIPVNEFSFGNTLIVAGTTLATGGLVVIGLSAVVSQLHRIAESMAGRAMLPTRPAEAHEAPAEARIGAGRMPFPSRTAARPAEPPMMPPMPMGSSMPMGSAMPSVPADLDAEAPQPFAPSMRNPEAQPVTVDDEVSLSPPHPMASMSDPGVPPPPSAPPREAPSSYFDNMWPAKPRTATAGSAKPEMPPRERETVARTPELRTEKARAAILKSGVVDGMAYTLYVDGSIEAELPQGTLRFASIDELRSHLEKNN
jgi:hypothetical protein